MKLDCQPTSSLFRPSSFDASTAARLHRVCLPESNLARLGEVALARAYCSFANSALERVVTNTTDGGLTGVALVSLRPGSMGPRLALESGLHLRAWRLALSPFIDRTNADLGGPEIVALFVDPAYRRQGIGAALLTAAIQACRSAHHPAPFLLAPDSNEAIGFCRSVGLVGSERVTRGQRTFSVLRPSWQLRSLR